MKGIAWVWGLPPGFRAERLLVSMEEPMRAHKLDARGEVVTFDGKRWTYSATAGWAEVATDAPTVARIIEAIRFVADRETGLAPIPRVVGNFESKYREKAKAALLEAWKQEKVELRPEGGMNRLTTEEKALCLPGPMGSLLSWCRLL